MSHVSTAGLSRFETMTRKLAEMTIGQSTPVTLGIVFTLISSIAFGSFYAGRLSTAVEVISIRVATLEAQRATDAANQATTNILLGRIQASVEDVKARVQNIENRAAK